MDATGIDKIRFITTSLVTTVFIDDIHTMYDAYKPNVLHEWINSELTQQDTSYIITEGTASRDRSFALNLIYLYFKQSNIYFCDWVRFNLCLTTDSSDQRNIETYCKFLSNLYTNSNILTPVNIEDLQIYPEYIAGINTKYNNIPPKHLDYFIKQVNDTKDIYMIKQEVKQNNYAPINLARSYTPKPESPPAVDKLNKRVTVKNINDFYNNFSKRIHIPERDKDVSISLIKYELLAMDYIHRNFAYRVAKWIEKMRKFNNLSPIPIKELWDFVVEQYKLTLNYYLPSATNTLIYAQCKLLDYMIILRYLELYEKAARENTRLLIWIPAGSAHTTIICFMIQNILDVISDEKCVVSEIGEDIIQSNKFTDWIIQNPFLGFKVPQPYDPSKIDANTYCFSYNAKIGLTDLCSLYPTSMKHKPLISKLIEDCTLLDDYSIRMITLAIINKWILVNYKPHEIAALTGINYNTLLKSGIIEYTQFQSNFYIDDDRRFHYKKKEHVSFTYPFASFYIPQFTPEEIIKMSSDNLLNYMQAPQSVKFNRLQTNYDILSLPANYTEPAASTTALSASSSASSESSSASSESFSKSSASQDNTMVSNEGVDTLLSLSNLKLYTFWVNQISNCPNNEDALKQARKIYSDHMDKQDRDTYIERLDFYTQLSVLFKNLEANTLAGPSKGSGSSRLQKPQQGSSQGSSQGGPSNLPGNSGTIRGGNLKSQHCDAFIYIFYALVIIIILHLMYYLYEMCKYMADNIVPCSNSLQTYTVPSQQYLVQPQPYLDLYQPITI